MQPVDPRIAAQRPTGCCSSRLRGCGTRSPLYLIGDAASRRGLSRVGYFITLNGPLNGHPPSLVLQFAEEKRHSWSTYLMCNFVLRICFMFIPPTAHPNHYIIFTFIYMKTLHRPNCRRHMLRNCADTLNKWASLRHRPISTRMTFG